MHLRRGLFMLCTTIYRRRTLLKQLLRQAVLIRRLKAISVCSELMMCLILPVEIRREE